MATVHILLGGNLGDSINYLSQALQLIEQEAGCCLRVSSFFETAPWGFEHHQNFINQVVVIETSLDPYELLNITQDIESKLGRVRCGTQYIARVIDIDILFYDDLVMNQKDLTIPHPHIQERMFTLAPLAEIDGQMIHPVLKKTMLQLKQDCADKLPVVRFLPPQQGDQA